MRVVIPREKWLRGGEGGILWDVHKDCGCVFGHYAVALGYEKVELHMGDEPSNVPVPHNKPAPLWPGWVVYSPDEDQDQWLTTATAGSIIAMNDSENITDDRREEELVSAFALHGVEVVFV